MGENLVSRKFVLKADSRFFAGNET
jgi:hypothetical protein